MNEPQLKIIYLSPKMDQYGGASYQNDVATELAAQHDVFFYGPGHDSYDATESIDDILAKAQWIPDIVCVGHAWLADSPSKRITPHGEVQLRELPIPKVILLNKEYTRLKDKLAYIREQKFGLVLTHHHATDEYERATGSKTVFWAFAADGKKFFPRDLTRDIDLFFSGGLQNRSHPDAQNDLRVLVQGKLYFSIGELKLLRRRTFGDRNIFWNAFSGVKWITLLDRALGRYQRIPDDEYQMMFSRSKVCFCTLSPLDLVGPRYFEAMASECLVYCQRSRRYEGLFDDKQHCLMFSEDLSDFEHGLEEAWEDRDRTNAIVGKASRHVLAHHTWEQRIKKFAQLVRGL